MSKRIGDATSAIDATEDAALPALSAARLDKENKAVDAAANALARMMIGHQAKVETEERRKRHRHRHGHHRRSRSHGRDLEGVTPPPATPGSSTTPPPATAQPRAASPARSVSSDSSYDYASAEPHAEDFLHWAQRRHQQRCAAVDAAAGGVAAEFLADGPRLTDPDAAADELAAAIAVGVPPLSMKSEGQVRREILGITPHGHPRALPPLPAGPLDDLSLADGSTDGPALPPSSQARVPAAAFVSRESLESPRPPLARRVLPGEVKLYPEALTYDGAAALPVFVSGRWHAEASADGDNTAARTASGPPTGADFHAWAAARHAERVREHAMRTARYAAGRRGDFVTHDL